MSFALVWFVGGLGACADLGTFPRDVCGNGIVEPENGEDCDLFPAGRCGAPNTPGQCRFLCTFGAADVGCPAGADYGCGSDGICRRPSGRYGEGDFVRTDAVSRLVSGDFDGDSRVDLATLGDLGTQEHLFKSATGSRTLSVTSRVDAAHVARFQPAGPGGQDDLLVVDARDPTARGVVVYDLTKSGVLDTLPAYQAKFPGVDEIQIARIDTGLLHGFDGPDDVLFVLRKAGGEYLTTNDYGPVAAPFTQRVVQPILVGRFDEDPVRAPCEQAAFLFEGSDKAWFFPPCVRANGQVAWNGDANNQPIRVLPFVQRKDGTAIDGAAIGDINGDGHLDIVTWSEMPGACARLYRAYGVGDGTFHSTPSVPPSSGDGLMDAFGPGEALTGQECVRDGSPFILKDLDGDGIVDVVTRDGVSSKSGTIVKAQGVWQFAAVGDFDADGRPDLAVSTTSRPGLGFFLGFQGGSIARSVPIATDGTPARLTVGDYDGDGAQDVAFLDQSLMPGGNASVAVTFGGPFGLPGPARELAQGFDPATQLVAGSFASALGARERISDLVLVQPPDVFSAFNGDPHRELVAPVELATAYPQANGILSIASARAGRFALGGGPGVAVLTLVDAATENESVEPLVLDAKGSLQAATRDLPSTPNVVPTVPGYKFTSYSAMAAVDLDGDAVDELVLLGNVRTAAPSDHVLGTQGPSQGQLLVAHRQAAVSTSGADWGFSAPVLLDESFALDSDLTDASFVDPRSIRTGDFDQDGIPDVLTFGKLGGATVLSLYRGVGSWQLGAANRIVFRSDSPELDRATAIAFPDAAGAKAIFLTPEGPFLGDLDAPGARLNLAAKPLTPYVATDASSGDFDADGVLDWALASSSGVQLLLGVPVLR